jgi:hypothetical protein
MAWPLGVVVVALVLVGGYYYVRLLVRIFKQMKTTLRVRGYNSPALHVAVAGVALVMPSALAFVALGYGHDQAWWVVLVLFGAVPLALTAAARRLPMRQLRTAGQRRLHFPYRVAGYILTAAGPPLWLAAVATGTNGWAQLGTVSLAGGLSSLAIARRAAQPDAAAVMARDDRPPVIYLRPFQQEEEVFLKVPWSWSNYRRYLRQNYLLRKNLHLTLEDFLGAEISARLGPFIALGNPTDFVPPPGAARTYVADEEWTRHFDAMVTRARCMVLLAASSEHVVWELAAIRSLQLESKLFVLTRPKPNQKTKIAAWSTFASALQKAGYPPCGDDAGPGAVVGFKPGGEPVILKRDAKTAEETVDVLCRRLTSSSAR